MSASEQPAKPEKSKAELRRERAAVQEAQREAKRLAKEEAERAKAAGVAPTEKKEKKDAPKKDAGGKKAAAAAAAPAKNDAAAAKPAAKKKKVMKTDALPPAVLRLGEQYKNFEIVGGNARCIALLMCMKELALGFRDRRQPHRRERQASAGDASPCTHADPLDSTAQPSSVDTDSATAAAVREYRTLMEKSVAYLTACRQRSYSMENGIMFMEGRLQSYTETSIGREDAFNDFVNSIDEYIDEIVMANKLIAEECLKPSQPHIRDGDVILTYGRSNAIEWVFRAAKDRGIKFEVIAVDSRPLHEGRKLALTLAGLGIPTRYCLISSLSSLLAKCSKVFVGAATMLTNGSLVSRSGTAMICMMANTLSKPVLAFCETYKFTDRVWLGSLTRNEQTDAEPLLQLCNGAASPLAAQVAEDEEGDPSVRLVNLMYDLTPAESLDIVVTEIGSVHPTAVPVILRERAS